MIRSTPFAVPLAKRRIRPLLTRLSLPVCLYLGFRAVVHNGYGALCVRSRPTCAVKVSGRVSLNTRQIRLQIRVPSAPVDPQQVHGRLADSRSTALHYPVPRQPSSCTLLQHLLGSHFPMPCLCILGNFVAALVPPLVGSLRCRLVCRLFCLSCLGSSCILTALLSSTTCRFINRPLSRILRISGLGVKCGASAGVRDRILAAVFESRRMVAPWCLSVR